MNRRPSYISMIKMAKEIPEIKLELIKSMGKETQFLFISHNKIAMEMAEQLIGVTMQEQGVSRIVAVDMEAAVSIAESA